LSNSGKNKTKQKPNALFASNKQIYPFPSHRFDGKEDDE